MTVTRRTQRLLARLVAQYLLHFPIQQGKSLINRFAGRFLEVQVFDGIRVRIINPLELHQKALLDGGEDALEPEVVHVFASTLERGFVFFDVGANLGLYSLLASQRVGAEGAVHAFEPAPEQFEHLRLNVAINKASNVFINGCALAEAPGERQLLLSEGWNRGIHSFAKTFDQIRSLAVRCTTVDDYVRDLGISRLDVMKIDVEGAELLVLRGASRTLRSLQPRFIVFEANESFCSLLGYSTRDTMRLLEDDGYALYRLERPYRAIRVSSEKAQQEANLLAVHDSAHTWCWDALSPRLKPE